MSATWMRLNTWPGLSIRLRAAARDLHQRILPGSVDSRQPQDRDRLAGAAAERGPGLLGLEPLAAARRDRRGRRRLVDPAAAVIAIDADGRQIDDRAQMRRARNASRRTAPAPDRRLRPAAPRSAPRSRRSRRRSTSGAASRHRTRKPRPCARRCRHPRSPPPSRACARCRRCGRIARRIPRCSARPNSRARSRTGWASTRRPSRSPPYLAPGRTCNSSAALHSSRTVASVSRARRSRREPCAIAPDRAARAPRRRRRAPAARHHRAAARPRAASAASPELPIAISTLRTKRSRPVRLTGDLANSARNAASSSRASSASFGARKRLARRKLRLAPGLRELVPRAHRETIVAAIDAVAHQRAQLARDRTLVLDRQVRDAAPRIEPVGRREGLGRADVEAGRARAAVIGLGVVRRELERGEDRAEEQPRAVLARNEIGVLALPAEPGRSPRAASPSRPRCRRTPSRRRRHSRSASARSP